MLDRLSPATEKPGFLLHAHGISVEFDKLAQEMECLRKEASIGTCVALRLRARAIGRHAKSVMLQASLLENLANELSRPVRITL